MTITLKLEIEVEVSGQPAMKIREATRIDPEEWLEDTFEIDDIIIDGSGAPIPLPLFYSIGEYVFDHRMDELTELYKKEHEDD